MSRKPTPPPPDDLPSIDDMMAPKPKAKPKVTPLASVETPNSSKKARKPAKQKPSVQVKKEAKKSDVMVYLQDELIDRLAMAQIGIRRLNRDLSKHKTTRSALIAHAITMMLDDFDENKGDSRVAEILESQYD